MFRLFSDLDNSDAVLFGVKLYCQTTEWDKTRKGKLLWWIYDNLQAITRLYRKWKLRIARDHVIVLPIEGSLCDSDERMFLACFETLRYYVEKELGKVKRECDTHYRGYRLHGGNADKKAIDLYFWYRTELEKLDNEPDTSIVEAVKDEKLRELIEIRQQLWT